VEASGPQQILSVAVPRPLEGLFTYLVPQSLQSSIQVGAWVRVPLGRTTTHAFVVEPPKPITEAPEGLPIEKLREVLALGSSAPIFTDDVLALCRWAHEYYRAPLGEVLHCAAPPAALGLKNTKAARKLAEFKGVRREISLTESQKVAFEELEALRATGKHQVALLHGVTGSGKTELYIELAKRALAEGRGVILLVPEIALTSQLHRRFEEGLGETVGQWHSAVADGKRRDQLAALLKGEIRVVVGARSAVFAPVQNLGLIAVDEEHDPTYKQEDRFRYNARDLAVVRSKIRSCMTVLGSATPSMETRERVREGKYAVARLDQRIAVGGLPKIEIVDLCEEERVEGTQAPLAKRTVDAIRETIASGGQAIVFLNRRGFAAFLVCSDCGHVKECPNCSISLTMHKRRSKLCCHVCGHAEMIPDVCERCQGSTLEPIGAGTESLEEQLPTLIPEAKTLRLDRDQVTSSTRLESILSDFREGKANVLLGTQMLAKGHDFPGVTLVVVVLADGLFRWPDFRAPERAFQILKQVSGRAGRGEKSGRVLIQTFQRSHPVIQTIEDPSFEASFLEAERGLRQELHYPPFGRMARIRFESPDQSTAQARATGLAQVLGSIDSPVEILGPSEAFLERAKGIYRWDLLLRSVAVQDLQRSISISKQHCAALEWPFLVDVDPNGVG
jgi:primosomal protein N' (replication factor Y)